MKPFTGVGWSGRPAAVVLLTLLLFGGVEIHAQTAANVAVVINDDSPVSKQIGEYYAQKRSVPESNIIRIRAAVTEEITRTAYSTSVERPISLALSERRLQDRVLYLVLTKGVPLRISGTKGTSGTGGSVDSELTLLYRRMTGRSVPAMGRVDNPYFLGDAPVRNAKPFSHRDHDLFLVTRLDAFTVEDALALVDRAQTPSNQGRILLDRRGDAAATTGDLWLVEAAGKLKELGHGDRVDLAETVPSTEGDTALGYYSWGSNDPANRRRRLGIQFAPGSLAATLAGTDARTFIPPPDGWEPGGNRDRTKLFAQAPQSLVGDLIRDGVTGVAGNVMEPLLASSARPQVLFPAYLSGFNLAESFYLSLPHLGWQAVIVGDPLCRLSGERAPAPSGSEPPIDETTGLPRYFADRRIEVVKANLPRVAPNVVALIVRGEGQLSANQKDAARGTFEEVTRLAPDLAPYHLQLGVMYEETGNADGAEQRYRRVLELQPRNTIALNNLAYRLAITDKAAEALPLARRAAAIAPQEPSILDTLGWILYLLGDYGEAAKVLTEAVRRDPAKPELRLHAAQAMLALGSHKSAESHLNEAVRLDPTYESRDEVRQLRAKLQKKD